MLPTVEGQWRWVHLERSLPGGLEWSVHYPEKMSSWCRQNYDDSLHPYRTSSWRCQKLQPVPLFMQNNILMPSKITTSAYTHAECRPGAVKNYD